MRYSAIVTALCILLLTSSVSVAEQPPAVYVFFFDTAAPMAEKWQADRVSLLKFEELKKHVVEVVTSLPGESLVVLYGTNGDRLLRSPHVRAGTRDASTPIAAFFDSLDGNAQQSLFWSSLKQVFEEAFSMVKSHPARQVHIFAYAAEDVRQGAGIEIETTLRQYRTAVTDGRLHVSFASIGFEFNATTRDLLRGVGAQVGTSMAVSKSPLLAQFHCVPPSPIVGEPVTIIDASLGNPLRRTVDWGDGTYSRPSKSHVYEKPGEYTIRFAVVAKNGEKATSEQQIIVGLPEPPTAGFSLIPAQIERGGTVVAVDRSAGAVARWEWQLSDGRRATDRAQAFSFAEAGEFEIALTVRDRHGRESVTSQKLTVSAPLAPVARIIGSDQVVLGETGTFVAHTADGVSRRWTIDSVGYGGLEVLRHTFHTTGIVTVQLTVEGPGGAATTSKRVRVLPPPKPHAGFVVAADMVVAGDEIVVTSTADGVIEKIDYELSGVHAPSGTVQPESPRARVVRIRTVVPGDLRIRQVVTGPGGKSQTARTVRVVPQHEAILLGGKLVPSNSHRKSTATSAHDGAMKYQPVTRPAILLPSSRQQSLGTDVEL